MSNRYSIVGTAFTGAPENFIASLKTGADLLLVREPQNPVDPRAVAVYVGSTRIGYLPRKQNGIISKQIDERGETPPAGFAFDSSMPAPKTLPAKFVRSPNSGFPMVEVAG